MDQARELRVLSYNLHGLRDDPAALVSVVREIEPDVAILQEAPRRLRWRTRCAQLANRFGLLYAAGGLPSLGNLLLVNHRVRIHQTWTVQYPLTPGRHLRGAVFAQASVAGTRFVLAGSHLATDPAERPDQAQRLKKEFAARSAPLIFAGDLNETAGGGAWRSLADGLVDPAAATDRQQFGTFPAGGPRQRIDVFFVDPLIAVTGYRVVDSPAARRASDHLPIVAELSIPAG